MALFCYGRLGTKSAILTMGRLPTMLGSSQYAQTTSGVPKITYKKFEKLEENYYIKNKRMKRPISPHFTIYKIQLTSSLSISNRFAGIILSAYGSVFGIGALVLPNDIYHYVTVIEGLNLSAPTLFLIKTVIAVPFAYHLTNGIRHLYWDSGRGLTLNQVYQSGYIALGATVIMSLALAAL